MWWASPATAIGSRGLIQSSKKFTRDESSVSDRPRRDLFACEAITPEVLCNAGIAAAEAEVIDMESQRFLEVVRFDHIGEPGRRRVLTVGLLDDGHYGFRDSWRQSAR